LPWRKLSQSSAASSLVAIKESITPTLEGREKHKIKKEGRKERRKKRKKERKLQKTSAH